MASITEVFVSAEAGFASQTIQNRKRRISPEAGRGLEILGHAIEYLTDEFFVSCGDAAYQKGALDAVELLMARNRQIYLACPIVPTLRERLLALLKSPRS